MNKYPSRIDLHMHSTVSDGTDTPEILFDNVRKEGIELFSVTDHDAVKAYGIIKELSGDGEPLCIPGVEFSCRDEYGKYHILGYGMNTESEPVRELVETGHIYRINKLRRRLEYLKNEFGIEFPAEDIQKLSDIENPGKPHIGNLMVKYGYAPTKEKAISDYIDKCIIKRDYLHPHNAIEGIIAGGGIPVLAHPVFGSGDEFISGSDMDKRLKYLIGAGLKGVEAFYSGFSKELIREMLGFAEKYSLYVTAGSDYHGINKSTVLGKNNLPSVPEYPDGLKRFLDDIMEK